MHGVELVDVLHISPAEYHPHAHTDFLLSVAWRRLDAVSDRTERLLVELQSNPHFTNQANNAVLQVATVPGHPLNAEWSHRQLASSALPERDVTWSYFCDQQDVTDGHLPGLIDWAWSEASHGASEDTRRLAALTLCWALTSSHRPTRDNATKALIALLEPAPQLYGPILQQFIDSGDDYIEERLLAVGCGLSQRTLSADTAIGIAEAVLGFTIGREYWPQNYLSRDYARRAVDAALGLGWRPRTENLASRIRPPYVSDWVAPKRSRAELNELAGAPHYSYSAIHHLVLSDFDDFRNYEVDSLLSDFQLEHGIDSDYLGAVLFEHALQLGWTPERFNTIDRHLSRDDSAEGKKREGYAQKYVWIAYRQLVGRITDRYPIMPDRRDDGRATYETPLDVRGHDIDPTMLLRRTENRVYADTPTTWYAPAEVMFPTCLDPNWTISNEHSPPVDRLLACRDEAGETWLALEGEYKWSQPQHPDAAAVGAPLHTIWAEIRSYLIDATDADAWAKWSEGQDFHGRWMPESGSPSGLLLADHPYKSDWPSLSRGDEVRLGKKRLPGKLVITTTRYGGMNDSDQSASRHLYTFMPSTAFCSALDLERIGDFRWGRHGTVEVESFAARSVGADTVHVTAEALGRALAANRQLLLWTVLAVKAKETTHPNHQWPIDGEPVFRTYSASFIFDGTSSRLLDAGARTMHAAGGSSHEAPWPLPGDALGNPKTMP